VDRLGRRRLFPIASVLLAACSAAPPPEPAPGCNPLGGEDCLSPFPAAVFTRAEPASPTGLRLDLRLEAMPRQDFGIGPIRPDRLNLRDGFSPATPFVVYFERGVEPTQLPPVDDPGRSLAAGSTVQLFDLERGERVPLFAELDANAFDTDRQALLIRPLQPLGAGRRYLVALVGLVDRRGEPLATAPFRALRDRAPLNQALAPLAERYETLFAFLAGQGVPRESLSLAWEVPIASDEAGRGPLLAMRDRALLDVAALAWTIDSVVEDAADPLRLREVRGTFEVPSFLAAPGNASRVSYDAAGRPQLTGRLRAPFTVSIPRCAATAIAPLPVMMFGHGLFSSASGEMASSNARKQAERTCMVQVGTDWVGLSSDDLAVVSTVVLGDLNNFEVTTDQLLQSHTNTHVLTRLFRTRMKDDPAFAVGGKPATDGAQVYYWGASNGGIQGATFLALSGDVSRGVLNVPGAGWNLMMFRSANFAGFLPILGGVIRDPLDQQIWVAMSQSLWDTTDPAAFAHHILGERVPGATADKAVLLQEAIGDTQVPNESTRYLARAISAPGLNLQEKVFGITEGAAPLLSAYTQWNVNSTPRPANTNMPPHKKNGAHDSIRERDELIEQNRRYLRPDGKVEETCGGPCTF
jgi:hypothetical protein